MTKGISFTDGEGTFTPGPQHLQLVHGNQLLITRAEAEAMVAAERALWVQAIETYFDATAVMDVEKYVERLRDAIMDRG